jgi:hypothetical protein
MRCAAQSTAQDMIRTATSSSWSAHPCSLISLPSPCPCPYPSSRRPSLAVPLLQRNGANTPNAIRFQPHALRPTLPTPSLQTCFEIRSVPGDTLVEDHTLELGLEPLDGILLGDSVLHANLQYDDRGRGWGWTDGGMGVGWGGVGWGVGGKVV